MKLSLYRGVNFKQYRCLNLKNCFGCHIAALCRFWANKGSFDSLQKTLQNEPVFAQKGYNAAMWQPKQFFNFKQRYCLKLTPLYVCHCLDGFTGHYCEIDIDDCASDPCRITPNVVTDMSFWNSSINHGLICKDARNRYQCSCQTGFTGMECEREIDFCQSNPCKYGNCHNSVNHWHCNCFEGFTGLVCDVDINECKSQPCLHGGVCYDLRFLQVVFVWLFFSFLKINRAKFQYEEQKSPQRKAETYA